VTDGTALFGRKYLLTLAPSIESSSAFQYGNARDDSAPLRITFDIKKDSKPQSNTGHMVIYNLSEKTRRTIKAGWMLQLEAGYDGLLQNLWVGQVGKGVASRNPDLSVSDKASTKREGAEVSYAIESAEGLGPLAYATIDKSYRSGTPRAQVFAAITKALTTASPATSFGVTIGSVPSGTFPPGEIRRNMTLHGKAADALTQLLEPLGYDWFVSNNELNVVARNDHTKDGAPLISAASGLIGIPSREDDGVVTISCLLNPQLEPGRLLKLESKDNSFDNYYKVRKVQHKGDSHGDAWTSEVQCIAYDSPDNSPDEPIDTPEVEDE